LRLCQLPGLDRGVEPVREGAVDGVIQLLRRHVQALGHVAQEGLPRIVVRLVDGIRRTAAS